MVLYTCYACLFSSNQKNDYNRHIKRKKHIKNVSEIEANKVTSQKDPKKSQKEPVFLCTFCDANFSSYANKRRHELHRCKEISYKDKKIKLLEKEKKKLEKQIEKMLDKTCTINNNTTNNNTNNNTNNIIVVNNYGKENTDYMTVDKIKKLLNRPYDSIQELIKMLHFNSDHPENHNVKITNKKEPFALVWNDPIWELRKKKTVVKDLVDKGYMMIDTTYEDVCHDTDNPNKKYVNFQNNFENEASNIKALIENESEIMIINETKKLDDN